MSIFPTSSHKGLSPECSFPLPSPVFISQFALMFSSPSNPHFFSRYTHPSIQHESILILQVRMLSLYLSFPLKAFNVFVIVVSLAYKILTHVFNPKKNPPFAKLLIFGCLKCELTQCWPVWNQCRMYWVHLQRPLVVFASPETPALPVAVLLIAASDQLRNSFRPASDQRVFE